MGIPTAGQNLTKGSNVAIQLERPSYSNNALELLNRPYRYSCCDRDILRASTACRPAGGVMGTILYHGEFDPQYYNASEPPYQNFNITVPNMITTGNARVNIAHVVLVGSGRAKTYVDTILVELSLSGAHQYTNRQRENSSSSTDQMNRPEQRDPDSTDSYTVAWICALEEEYFCACRMLNEEFEGPEISEDNDDNTYVYGRIAKHYVVIGCLPAGRYGTNSAARVARDMVRTFPRLRFALMVGIGGGAPTTRNDIRLGDVVVSQPKDGFGGVIQYDLGKLKDGHFHKTGQLNSPPEKLLGVIPEMRRLHSDERKPDRLGEHLQRLDDMEDYHQPTVDRLYTTKYPHVDGQNCKECDSNSVVVRPERHNRRTLHVHYGNIASGNSVLKDAIVRDIYANDPELNILCFEMEAAGLMNNIPCLIIRGICDYCDSHKNDDWHKYAALTAAAYARELLLVLRPQRVDALPPWGERVAQELQQG
ncbi:unnamed protein product [Penicillium viridicatum]